MTINQTATRLGTSPTHIRRLVRTGDLQAVDVSRKNAKRRALRILPEAFDQFIESRSDRGQTEQPKALPPGLRAKMERAGLL